MVDPITAGAAVAVSVTGIAAGYSYFSGNGSEVDVDSDGNNEIEYLGDESTNVDFEVDTWDCNDDADDPAYRDDALVPTNASASGLTEGSYADPTPDKVSEIGAELEEIKGVGPVRAQELRNGDYESAADLYYASDENLEDVNGLGPRAVSHIREDIGGIDVEGNGQSDDDSDTQVAEESSDEQSNSSQETTSEEQQDGDTESSDNESQTETGSSSTSDEMTTSI